MKVTDGNGRLNGRVAVIGYSVAGIGGIGGFLAAIGTLVTWQVAPIAQKAMQHDQVILRLETEIGRIGGLAAERGVAIPQLRQDILRLETELGRMRERLERVERPVKN